MGVLVDHLVPGTKSQQSSRAPTLSRMPRVLVVGHPYVDVWRSVRPERLGWQQWPVIPRGTSWKLCRILRELGWPHATQADVAHGWKQFSGPCGPYADPRALPARPGGN